MLSDGSPITSPPPPPIDCATRPIEAVCAVSIRPPSLTKRTVPPSAPSLPPPPETATKPLSEVSDPPPPEIDCSSIPCAPCPEVKMSNRPETSTPPETPAAPPLVEPVSMIE